MRSFFYHILKLGYVVSSKLGGVDWGPSRIEVEAKGDTNDEDPNISDGGTLLVIYII